MMQIQTTDLVLPAREVNPFWYKLKKNPMTLIGLAILGIIILLSLLAPLITSYDPNKINVIERFQSPTVKHWFGTDEVGRDIFTRILYGARLSLGIGVLIVTAAGLAEIGRAHV